MTKKRKKPFAANAASRAYLRDLKWAADIVEQTIPKCFIKRDLFGFIDIVAVDLTTNIRGVLGIQATTASNLASRRDKILATPIAKAWVSCGNELHIHAWKKKPGQKPTLTVHEVKLEDFK